MVSFNLEKFQRVLENFAGKLKNCGEDKAAEAIESVIKSLPLYVEK